MIFEKKGATASIRHISSAEKDFLEMSTVTYAADRTSRIRVIRVRGDAHVRVSGANTRSYEILSTNASS